MDGHNWWWKENCNEGILLQLSLPVGFVLLWAQLSREASIFVMVKTDRKIWNISQKSDKNKMSKRNWAAEQTDTVVFISEALFRSCFLAVALPADGIQRWGSASELLEFRLRSRTHQHSVCRHPSLIYYESQDYFSLRFRLPQIWSSRSILALN